MRSQSVTMLWASRKEKVFILKGWQAQILQANV